MIGNCCCNAGPPLCELFADEFGTTAVAYTTGQLIPSNGNWSVISGTATDSITNGNLSLATARIDSDVVIDETSRIVTVTASFNAMNQELRIHFGFDNYVYVKTGSTGGPRSKDGWIIGTQGLPLQYAGIFVSPTTLVIVICQKYTTVGTGTTQEIEISRHLDIPLLGINRNLTTSSALSTVLGVSSVNTVKIESITLSNLGPENGCPVCQVEPRDPVTSCQFITDDSPDSIVVRLPEFTTQEDGIWDWDAGGTPVYDPTYKHCEPIETDYPLDPPGTPWWIPFYNTNAIAPVKVCSEIQGYYRLFKHSDSCQPDDCYTGYPFGNPLDTVCYCWYYLELPPACRVVPEGYVYYEGAIGQTGGALRDYIFFFIEPAGNTGSLFTYGPATWRLQYSSLGSYIKRLYNVINSSYYVQQWWAKTQNLPFETPLGNVGCEQTTTYKTYNQRKLANPFGQYLRGTFTDFHITFAGPNRVDNSICIPQGDVEIWT